MGSKITEVQQFPILDLILGGGGTAIRRYNAKLLPSSYPSPKARIYTSMVQNDRV